MRKPAFFLIVLSLFLLVPASITWAQTITQQKGITTAVFNTGSGQVRIILPDDLRPGDIITGTVLLEPAGKAGRQAEKNLGELSRHTLTVAGQNFTFGSTEKILKFRVPDVTGKSTSLELFAPGSSTPLQSLHIPGKPIPEQNPEVNQCTIPTHALTGDPVRIRGSFDGDMSNTRCRLDNIPVKILAESPRQTIISYPEKGGGLHNLTIEEPGQSPCNRQVSGVEMNVSAGKLNLLKGEKTYIDVQITGLQNLPDVATLSLTNLSASTVTMFPSNTIVIPFPPDSVAEGNFNRRFDIQSIQTGSFNVNINLDLPETQNANPTDEVPPGYTRKSCQCSASVSISKTNGNGNTNSYKASATTACTGQYGIGINTFPRCSVRSVSYLWTLGRGKENADLVGSATDSTASVRKKNNNGYIICVKVIVVCIDGTTCEATACSDQDGNPVNGPGTTTRPEDGHPPTNPGEPEHPPTTTERRKCKCICSAAAAIVKLGRVDSLINFMVNVNANCKLEPCPTGSTVVQCSVKSITYNWAVTSGAGVVVIRGAANGPGVTLKIIGVGAYVLTVTGTVTCSDGTTCSYLANIEDEISGGKSCNFSWQEKIEPAMDGGLLDKYRARDKKIRRDDFIPLGAEGRDFDLLKWICEPVKPDCEDSRSEKTITLNGRVRFEWRIAEGPGGFVKLGCLPGNQTDEGEHIIFMPPFVPLPIKAVDTSLTTVIRLSVIDDNSTQVLDTTLTRTITIVTKRKKSDPDFYFIDVIKHENYRLPAAPNEQFIDGTCRATGVRWTKIDKLPTPVINRPDVTDKEKMVLGQWIVLNTDVRDIDNAQFLCVSQHQCPTSGTQKDYEDDVRFDWSASGGSFISDPTGRFVIFQAPLEMPANQPVISITIKVKASNPGASLRKDRDSDEGEIVLRIFQPGIKLGNVPANWLPEDSNFVTLTSELKYKEGNNWQPALAHMCRIHFFELKDISTEKGVCMNAPLENATLCRDLQLKNEEDHEAFMDSARNCRQKELFMQARTKQPVISYSIKVYSNDFGSFGFLRSFANLNKGGKDSIKGEKPEYISIPWKRSELTHPQNRQKKTEYRDNRVTIPLDIDENHIADAGWNATGAVRLADPANETDDDDGTPGGDSQGGDGLSNYEEYRGFKIKDNTAAIPPHIRTNYSVKDIFINNVHNMPISLFTTLSAMDVHVITPEQYFNDNVRVVNFNYTTRATHVVDQMGLRLVDLGTTSGLLGIVHSVFCSASNPRCAEGRPSPPNWIREVRIYSGRITEACTKRGLNRADKLAAVVAHELFHANNVCHHGESTGDPEEGTSNHNNRNGTRSGNVNCVMRYDNIGATVDGNCAPVKEKDANPEAIGNSLCDSPAGTGYNTSSFHEERKNGRVVKVEDQNCFGNAATNRGNCVHQIRVSGRGWRSSAPRANAPLSCGNRGL